MNRAVMLAPFADEELHTFKGRGGQDMTYIEDETVMDRLDAGFGPGNWQIQTDAVSENVAKVRLGVRENGEWVWYEDFGYPNREGGESLKEAVSDGIRRCGRYVGIARDLYRRAPDERRTGGYRAPSHPTGVVDVPGQAPLGPPKDTPEGGLIGTVVTKDRYDLNLRETPEGWVLPFRIKNGSSSFGVVAENELAQVLDGIKATILDQRVTVWGHWSDEVTPAKGTKPAINWRLLHLERIATHDGILPAPAFDSKPEALPPPLFDDEALPEPPDDVALPGERVVA